MTFAIYAAIVLAYLALFVLTWGATYAYFTTRFAVLDSPEERKLNHEFAVLFSSFQPFTFIGCFLMSGFFRYGFQWAGGPRKRKSGGQP